MIAILRTPYLRSASNVFKGSLAAADLTIGFVMNPLYVAIVVQDITDSTHPLNVVEHYFWIHTVITTTLNLSAMSNGRYITAKRNLFGILVFGASPFYLFAQELLCTGNQKNI